MQPLSTLPSSVRCITWSCTLHDHISTLNYMCQWLNYPFPVKNNIKVNFKCGRDSSVKREHNRAHYSSRRGNFLIWHPTKQIRRSVPQFDTNHTLLEARLVAGSKLTRDMSHPPTSYKEGVSFPGRKTKQSKDRGRKSDRGNHEPGVILSVGIISLNFMFACRELNIFGNIAAFIGS